MRWAAIQPLIGGMPIGFAEAYGTKPQFILSYPGIKNDLHLCKYWPDVPYLTINPDGSISDENAFRRLNVDISVVAAVPICSGLSMMNSSHSSKSAKGRGSDAVQNENMYGITRLALERINPQAFCAENAPGLFTNAGLGVRQKLLEIGAEFGRKVSFYKTSCYLHDIPQKRSRTFYFMWKGEEIPELNWYDDIAHSKELATYLCGQEGLPHHDVAGEMARLAADNYFQFIKSKLGSKWREVYHEGHHTILQWIIAEKQFDDAIRFALDAGDAKLVARLSTVKDKTAAGGGYWDDSPHIFIEYIAAVVGRTAENGVHPVEDRYFTTRELMHLMGLPPSFNLVNEKQRAHITQNVPVPVARAMAREIEAHLTGKRKVHVNIPVLMQNNESKTISQDINHTVLTKKVLHDFGFSLTDFMSEGA